MISLAEALVHATPLAEAEEKSSRKTGNSQSKVHSAVPPCCKAWLVGTGLETGDNFKQFHYRIKK